MHSLEKELHPQRIGESKANYNTHIRGKSCTISTDNNLGTLTLNGPGRKLRRETVFDRFAYHLYQQFKTDTDADLDGSIFAQNSRNATGLHSYSLMSPVLSVATGNDELQTQLVTSISHEVHELKQISQLLKEQVSAIDSKIEILLKRAEQRSSSLSPPISFITRSEVSGDTTRLSPGPKSYSEIINSGACNQDSHAKANVSNNGSINNSITNSEAIISASNTKSDTGTRDVTGSPSNHVTLNKTYSLEIINQSIDNTTDNMEAGVSSRSKNQSGNMIITQNVTEKQAPLDKSNDTEISSISPSQTHKNSRTLLIGDSIISGVNKRGLARNVECVPISGGNIDSITNKLEIFDISKFDNVIITVGGNDASNNTDLGIFHNKFSDLIKTIKLKNSKCKLFLCTSCPRGDTDVTDVNDVIF